MNAGDILYTKNLILRPGNNETDNGPFIDMLRKDDDFHAFPITRYMIEQAIVK